MKTLHYPSLTEFLTECTAARKQQPGKWFVTESDLFAGCSFTDAMRFASTGWPEGTRKVQSLSASLTAKLTNLIEVPHLAYDVTGADFDIGLYVSGRPECWYRMENTYQEGSGTNVLKMVYNIGARGHVATSAMTARGVVAASLISLLERCGRRVELVAVNRVGYYSRETADIRIPVKQADQELDIDRLSFILANPAMLRRLSFAVRALKCGEQGGEGGSEDVPETEQGDIYFPAGVGKLWENQETAVAYVKSELVKQGIEIREA